MEQLDLSLYHLQVIKVQFVIVPPSRLFCHLPDQVNGVSGDSNICYSLEGDHVFLLQMQTNPQKQHHPEEKLCGFYTVGTLVIFNQLIDERLCICILSEDKQLQKDVRSLEMMEDYVKHYPLVMVN